MSSLKFDEPTKAQLAIVSLVGFAVMIFALFAGAYWPAAMFAIIATSMFSQARATGKAADK